MENFTPEGEMGTPLPATTVTQPSLPSGRMFRQAAWSFIGANFWRLVVVTAVSLLVSAVTIIGTLLLQSLVEQEVATITLYGAATVVALVSVVTSVFTLSLMAVTTVAAKEVSLRNILARTMTLIWPLSITVFLSYAVMGAGFLLLIIPGIIVSVLLVPVLWVVTDEGLTLRAALIRSMALVSGRWWAVTGRLLLALLLVLLLSIGFVLVGLLLVPLFFALSFVNLFAAAILSGLLALGLYIVVSTVLGFYLLRYSYELYVGLRDTVTSGQVSWWQGTPLTVLMIIGVCLGAAYLVAMPHIMIEDLRGDEEVLPEEFLEWEERNPDFLEAIEQELLQVEAI
jgi:hypothetical protein